MVIDKSSFAKADKELSNLESRIKGLGTGGGFRLGRFSVKQDRLEAALLKGLEIASTKLVFNINKFDVNQTALNIALGTALDVASTRNTFHISRFNVDQSHLNGAMINAMANAARVASQTTALRPRVSPVHTPGNGAVNEGSIRPRHAAVAGGIAGGLSRVYGPALALGLGGYGLSELNQRNQQVVSAQLQSQAVVQQAGGTAEQGQQSFQWLRSEGNRIGFNYLDASGDYNKLLSGLTGAGMSVKEGQGVFKGFSELSRVNKLDRVTQQRVYRALSQIAGKGKLQGDELTNQLAEALPGSVSLFAQAYQNQLAQQGKGGGKTGQEAINDLFAAMKKGQVKGDILTYAGEEASRRAAPGLDAASKASQAEQARYQNSVNDLAVLASQKGVEEGFARIFRTLNDGLKESGDLVGFLAEGFNDVTKWADDLLLWPQSFVRALQGRDSLVADWLGRDSLDQLREDWKDIKTIFDDISKIKFDFLPDLKATSEEVAKIMNAIAEFKRWKESTGEEAPTLTQDKAATEKASFLGFKYTSPVAVVSDIWNNSWAGAEKARVRGRAIYEDPSSPFYNNPEKFDADREGNTAYYQNLRALARNDATPITDTSASDIVANDNLEEVLKGKLNAYGRQQAPGVTNPYDFMAPVDWSASLPTLADPSNPNGAWQPTNPQEQADWNRQAAMSQAEASVTNNNITNNFDVSINVDATLAGIEVEQQAQAMADAFSTSLTGAFEQAQVNWPKKE